MNIKVKKLQGNIFRVDSTIHLTSFQILLITNKKKIEI